MGFTISRFWNKDPYWFEDLDKQTQIKLISDYQLYHLNTKELEKEKRLVEFRKIQEFREGIKTKGAKK